MSTHHDIESGFGFRHQELFRNCTGQGKFEHRLFRFDPPVTKWLITKWPRQSTVILKVAPG
jgi:hypothetical protein